jgi:Na+/H+-dicarboxylate symporter
MSLDMKMLTGIVIGVVLGLYYHQYLAGFLPVLTIAVIVLLFKTLYHPRVR